MGIFQKIGSFLAGLAWVICISSACVAANQSSINPQLPAQNAPLTSPVVRGNFGAAYNDINNIYSILQSNPSYTGAPNSLAGYNNAGTFSGVTVGTNLSLSGGVLSATASGLPSGGMAFDCLRKDATGTTTVWGNCLGSPVTSSPSGAGIVTQSALNLVTQSGLNIIPQ